MLPDQRHLLLRYWEQLPLFRLRYSLRNPHRYQYPRQPDRHTGFQPEAYQARYRMIGLCRFRCRVCHRLPMLHKDCLQMPNLTVQPDNRRDQQFPSAGETLKNLRSRNSSRRKHRKYPVCHCNYSAQQSFSMYCHRFPGS